MKWVKLSAHSSLSSSCSSSSTAVYFATLAITTMATGLEPLKFFHAATRTLYLCARAAQSLGYVAYHLLQMVHLAIVFLPTVCSGDVAVSGENEKLLVLAQIVIGLAVGAHYCISVFQLIAAGGDGPKADWFMHAEYAACFLVVCGCARAGRKKKAYVLLVGGNGEDSSDDDEQWKKS